MMLITAVFCILLTNFMLKMKIDFMKLIIVNFAAISPRFIERRASSLPQQNLFQFGVSSQWLTGLTTDL